MDLVHTDQHQSLLIKDLADKLTKYLAPIKSYYVGGCVRDELLGLTITDIDIEFYGLSLEGLEQKVRDFLKAEKYSPKDYWLDTVGASFGVLKLRIGESQIDLSLPRTENKIGIGHKAFAIKPKANLTPKIAASRRDFTINALMRDTETGEILDFFDGQKDLNNKILRAVDPTTFIEDPLRVLRGLQFAARFNLTLEAKTRELFITMIPELHSLAPERLRDEWTKLLLKADQPSIGLQLGMNLGIWDVWYPLFRQMLNTPQEAEWHPEGDVWTHTLMVTDKAAKIIRGDLPRGFDSKDLTEREKFIIVMGAFCHDFGKPATTVQIDGRWRARGHDLAGLDLVEEFLLSFRTIDRTDIDAIKTLTAEHLWPGMQYILTQKGGTITDGAFRRLAARLKPANIQLLSLVACADHLGRGPFKAEWQSAGESYDASGWPIDFPAGRWMLEQAHRLQVDKEPAKPIVSGQEIMDLLGIKPGPKIGELMQLAQKMHDEDNLSKAEIFTHLTSTKL